MAIATGTDRLRELIDLLVQSIDDRARGEELARRAYLSRFHFDRLVGAALGETPAALRRRLLLERAAYQLLRGASVTEAAVEAGYSSPEAFARSFRRAFATLPSAFGGDSDFPRRTAFTSTRREDCSFPATTRGGKRWI